MNSMLNWFIAYCVDHHIVSAESTSWLRYGLEKRLYTLLVFIPFLIVSIHLSDFVVSTIYIFSFFYLRSMTSGFHCKC